MQSRQLAELWRATASKVLARLGSAHQEGTALDASMLTLDALRASAARAFEEATAELLAAAKAQPARASRRAHPMLGDAPAPGRVTSLAPGFDASQPMYSGLLDVPSTTGTGTDYIYFLHVYPRFTNSSEEPDSTPLVLWLNGGPGQSSQLGAWAENGPYRVERDDSAPGGFKLARRNNSWTDEFHVLFIDQPAGVGYSVLTNASAGAHSDDMAVTQAYDALVRFYALYPDMLSRKLYITGESCECCWVDAVRLPAVCMVAACRCLSTSSTSACLIGISSPRTSRPCAADGGHYLPQLATKILDGNKAASASSSSTHIPLVGMAVGNGLTSGCVQAPHSVDYALAMGLVDSGNAALMDAFGLLLEAECANYLSGKTNSSLGPLIGIGLVWGAELLFSGVNDENFRLPATTTYGDTLYIQWLNETATKEALHVFPDETFVDADLWVKLGLLGDLALNMIPLYTRLLAEIDVLIYHGLDDPVFVAQGDVDWIGRIDWPGSAGFANATRRQWHVSSQAVGDAAVAADATTTGPLAGYAKSYSNLTFVEVLWAGHMVPTDAAAASLDMLRRWISGHGF